MLNLSPGMLHCRILVLWKLTKLLYSVLDPRDHPYVLGATKAVPSFVDAVQEGTRAGKDYMSIKEEWQALARLMTFDDAVKAAITSDQYDAYIRETADKVTSLQERREIVKRLAGKSVEFDWELPRTPLGQYRWQWCTKAVLDRCVLAAPLGDVSWSRQGMLTVLATSYTSC